ncbi:MAG TPA: GNAT family N-acetyltransferase [Chloroflexota bacterium]|nr:GNAT family N-acetyltransferase [Chloroflexota bacterium]
MIRIAGKDDANAIARLLVQLGYPDTTAADALRRLEGMTSRLDPALFVDDTNGVTGVIHVCVTETLEHEPRGEIRTLVVDDAHRNAGAGARLVDAAEEWARARGLSKMRVRSNIKRERARRFYERLGYSVTKTQNVFDKLL